MKLSREEQNARIDAFRRMGLREKLDYIFMYYRLPIALGLIALVVLCVTVSRALTKKEAVLYLGYANVAVGDALNVRLTEDFVRASGMDTGKKEILAYAGLYLSENPSAADHEYSYASRLKVLAAVNAKQLDLVLMNREAYDFLSRSGYLLDLSVFLAEDAALGPCLRENTVVLEDNAIEFRLNETETYQAVTEKVSNAVEVTALPPFRAAGFPDSVYLGVIANSPRFSAAVRYIHYLAAQDM